MSECKETTCDTTSQTECCPVEQASSQNCCPVEFATKRWKKAFFKAMCETQTEILKEKIRKKWGKVMDKEADATLAAMEAYYGSVMAQAKASCDLRESFKQIFQEMGE